MGAKLTLDVVGLTVAAATAMAITTGTPAVGLALCVAALRVTTLAMRGTYAHSWRHTSLRDTFVLVPALLGPTVVFAVAAVMTSAAEVVATLVLEGLLATFAALAARASVRWLDERQARSQAEAVAECPARPVLLVGAGRAGTLAARELGRRPDLGYRPIGFLDDDPSLRGRRIEGLEVFGTTADAETVAAGLGVECLILALPSATPAQRRSIVARLSDAGLDVRTIPDYHDLLAGKVELTKIRPVKVEDLLGRNVVETDASRWSEIVATIKGKRVLVTGAGGSIGSELCRQIADLEPERLVLLEGNENNLFDIEGEVRKRIGARAVPCLADVRDVERMQREFAHHRPQVVFHAAAFKHVPMMELHPDDAILNNVFGTKTVVEAAESVGVERFLFVSTDKAVNPANVMGASKRMAEMVVQAHASRSRGRFCCVRFGNVLGSRGSVIHTFRRQIENGGPVTVTHPDVTRFFMTIPEAVRLLIQSNAVQDGGEVFLLDMGEPVRIMDLAKQMIHLSGLTEEDVPISVCGLRPGEKLYEELLRDEEGTLPSKVDGVFHAKLAPVSPASLGTWLGRLDSAARSHDEETIRRILAIAAGYRPDPAAAPVPAPLPAVSTKRREVA
ncbi:MAG: polysaccharide biosynthesis protein [Nannocystaceae bacterium]|nr:polysaccharide biosynthesis protein [bacterium]